MANPFANDPLVKLLMGGGTTKRRTKKRKVKGLSASERRIVNAVSRVKTKSKRRR